MGLTVLLTTAGLAANITPAHATFTTGKIGGILFSALKAKPLLGAMVTGYDGSAGTALKIPATVNLGSKQLQVTGLAEGALLGQGLTKVELPQSITKIAAGALANNNLSQVNLPQAVTTIGAGALANNDLRQVTIPSQVTTIEAGAFGNNDLTNITVGEQVQRLAVNAFAGNPGQTTVQFTGGAPTITGGQVTGQIDPALRETLSRLLANLGNSQNINDLIATFPCKRTTSNTPGSNGTTSWNGYTVRVSCSGSHTVNFNSNGGSTVPSTVVNDGSALAIPAIPARPGYIFTGWYTNAQTTVAYSFSARITASVTLYAGWTPTTGTATPAPGTTAGTTPAPGTATTPGATTPGGSSTPCATTPGGGSTPGATTPGGTTPGGSSTPGATTPGGTT
ncbi:MAG: InlB B-repeat-containing protein, partial [Propioniciclava sp.]